MNILELSKKRFSVRKYSDTPVSEEDLQYILEVTRMAPSAVNKQPWKFVIVRSDAARKQLQECYNREWFKSAPLYIICMREVDNNWIRQEDNKQHGDIDVAIATEHLCLAATERGLGSCWVCNFDVAKLKETFPYKGFEPIAIIPIGHIADDCPLNEKKRKALEEITDII